MDTQNPQNLKKEEEHPAHRAARLIKEMHEKTIEMIDAGHKFVSAEDKETDVSQIIREKCVEQVACCQEVMARADGLSEEHTRQAHELLIELTGLTYPTAAHEQEKNKEDVEEQELPDVGSFDHRNGG